MRKPWGERLLRVYLQEEEILLYLSFSFLLGLYLRSWILRGPVLHVLACVSSSFKGLSLICVEADMYIKERRDTEKWISAALVKHFHWWNLRAITFPLTQESNS